MFAHWIMDESLSGQYPEPAPMADYPIWWKMNYKSKQRLIDEFGNPPPEINHKEFSNTSKRLIVQIKYPKDETCAICLNNMKNTTVKYAPCGHIFHSKCLNELFSSRCRSKKNCPNCRAKLIYTESGSGTMNANAPPSPPPSPLPLPPEFPGNEDELWGSELGQPEIGSSSSDPSAYENPPPPPSLPIWVPREDNNYDAYHLYH
jgi:hypothetical protein